MILEIIGTIIFALQGSLVAIEHDLDVLGIMISALTTAVGGGMTRDIILGNTPPNMFKDPIYCIWAAVTACIVICTYKVVAKNINAKVQPWLKQGAIISDAIGLGIFTVVGAKVCMQAGFEENAFLCIFVGVMTGVGGGIIRDILVRRTPVVLRKEIYAVAAIIGGIIYWHLNQRVDSVIAIYVSTCIIIVIRLIAVKKDLHLPRINDKQMMQQ